MEKDAYKAMATLERMHWLVDTPAGFDLLKYHKNLILIFDPLSFVPDRSQTALSKVLQWEVRLSLYSYTRCHISGKENI